MEPQGSGQPSKQPPGQPPEQPSGSTTSPQKSKNSEGRIGEKRPRSGTRSGTESEGAPTDETDEMHIQGVNKTPRKSLLLPNTKGVGIDSGNDLSTSPETGFNPLPHEISPTIPIPPSQIPPRRRFGSTALAHDVTKSTIETSRGLFAPVSPLCLTPGNPANSSGAGGSAFAQSPTLDTFRRLSDGVPEAVALSRKLEELSVEKEEKGIARKERRKEKKQRKKMKKKMMKKGEGEKSKDDGGNGDREDGDNEMGKDNKIEDDDEEEDEDG